MGYGEIRFDDDGLPICEICGKSFKRLLTHVRQKHFMSAREYKEQFGLDVSKGIMSEESREKSRYNVYSNFGKVVIQNLIEKGEETRYKDGDKGRTKDMVSEQTKKMLTKHCQTNMSPEKRKELGMKLGKSGKGNQARWKSKE